MAWLYKGKVFEGPSDSDYGFIYIITNKESGKRYIGKKLFWFKKFKTVKKKRKRILVESDWRNYWSSSATVKADVEALGEDKFEREIIHLVPSKSAANYLEAKEQFTRGVLESTMWYNDWISVRVTRRHIQNNGS